MRGIGTICNFLAIIVGGMIGVTLKNGISERFQKIIMQANSLAVIFIGISGALSGMLKIQDGKLSTQATMLVVMSLVIGSIIGESINIEAKLEGMGNTLKRLVKNNNDSQFVEGFVTASLIVCVGAMAIVGSIQDGISGDPSILYVKSVLDFLLVMVCAASMGVGPAFSAFPLLIYQGLITLLAVFIESYLTETMILNVSTVGSILIFGVGYNVLFGKKFSVGNMLPALLIPVIYEIILNVIK